MCTFGMYTIAFFANLLSFLWCALTPIFAEEFIVYAFHDLHLEEDDDVDVTVNVDDDVNVDSDGDGDGDVNGDEDDDEDQSIV